MSRCAYCGGPCSAHADENSHGICDPCAARVSPNSPRAVAYREAMSRGLTKMVNAGMVNLALAVMLEGLKGARA